MVNVSNSLFLIIGQIKGLLSIATNVKIIFFIFLPFLFFTRSIVYFRSYFNNVILSFFSFDGAKVRRFFGLRKRFRKIVHVHSAFIDAYQIILLKEKMVIWNDFIIFADESKKEEIKRL